MLEQIRQLLPQDIEAYFYRTHNGAECDLVLVKGFTPISAIEIKYTVSPVMTKGFRIAIDDLGTSENYIITPHTEVYSKTENVKVCSLVDYLDKFIPH